MATTSYRVLEVNDNFYRIFEERFYAPREVIKELRKQYLPFVSPLAVIYPDSPAFDAGCGRGEWLELMREVGFKPYGVDLDQGMLDGCMDLNLPAQRGDAIAFLSGLTDESQAVVSAFHVVEHINFDQLRTLVSEAFRTLKPGGLLLIETPNPENILVSTKNFYLDPTHQRPIPPQLLSFLPEYYGFERVKILRLQQSSDLAAGSVPMTLLKVLSGVSPDYAVIAQKNGGPELMAATKGLFAQEYGLSLEQLAERYEEQLATRIECAESKAQLAETALSAIRNSHSWRITAPARALAQIFRRLKNG